MQIATRTFACALGGSVACGGPGASTSGDSSTLADASSHSEAGNSADASTAGSGPAHESSVATSVDGSETGDTDADSGDTSVPVLCPDEGWCEVPDTKTRDVCPEPSPGGVDTCMAVVQSWSGGAADTTNQRLIFWGGGHGAYYGNEVYAFDLLAASVQRLTDPSPVPYADAACPGEGEPEAMPDGRPNSRHTYDGLTYIASRDAMMASGGSLAKCGNGSGASWLFDLDALEWTMIVAPDAVPSGPGGIGVMLDYDAENDVVYAVNPDVRRLDVATWQVEIVDVPANYGAGWDYHMTGRHEPVHDLFVMVGGASSPWGGLVVVELASDAEHKTSNWTTRMSGCDELLDTASPGLTFDTERQRLVGWGGGDTVFEIDLDARSCHPHTFAGGPGPASAQGTFGRFRFFPDLGVYAVVNDVDQNAFLLRLPPA